MANQYFSVKEQIFDIRFTNRELVHELQNRISRLANNNLATAIDLSLQKLIPENAVIKLDTITLDIGEVAYDQLEQELEARIIETLESELAKIIYQLRQNQYPSASGSIAVHGSSGNLLLLEYFLLNGTLPWWVQQATGFNLDRLIEELFTKDASDLRILVLKVGQQEYVRRRLVFQLNADSIRRLIQVLEPSEAAYIIGYHQEVVTLQQKEQLVQTELSVFEKAVWLFVITYLVDDRGSEFNRKAFVKSSLVQMAAYFGVGYLSLIHVFYRAVSVTKTAAGRPDSLKLFISELAIEEEQFRAGQFQYKEEVLAKPVPNRDPARLSVKLDTLLHYLVSGALPANDNMYSREELAGVFAELAATIPETLKEFLQRLQAGTAFGEHFYRLLGAKMGKELLQILYPEGAKLLSTFSALVELAQAKTQLLKGTPQELKELFLRLQLSTLVFTAKENQQELFLLRAFINQLAKEYHINAGMFANTIESILREEFRRGINNSNIPDLVNTLVAETDVQKKVLSATDNTQEISRSEEEKNLQDLLIYLLQYGQLPWWGRTLVGEQSTDALFKQISITSPQAVIQLMKFAGTDARWQRRLLSYVSLPVLYELMQALPNSPVAIASVKQLATWIGEEAGGGSEELKTGLHKAMLLALWDHLIDYSYRSFSLTGLYSLSILRAAAWLAKPPLQMAQIIEKRMNAIDTIDEHSLLEKELIDNIIIALGAVPEDAGMLNEKRARKRKRAQAAEQITTPDEADELRVRELVAAVTATKKANKGKRLHDALFEMLEYFFLWNRLPDSWRGQDAPALDIILKQSLLILYQEKRVFLQRLLQQQVHAPAARVLFHDLALVSKGGMEKEIALFLQPFKEQYQLKFLDQSKPALELPLGKMDGSTAETGEKRSASETTADELFRMADHFLHTQQRPARVVDETSVDDWLIKTITRLYQSDEPGFISLLEKTDHLPQARLRLHDLMMLQTGALEKEVLRKLEPYKEKDAIAFFSTKETGVNLQHVSNAASQILKLLAGEKKSRKKTELWLQVNNSPLLTSYLLTDPAGITTFIRRSGVGWGNTTGELMDGLRLLITEAVGNNLDRDQLLNILAQFNLLFLSGKIIAKSDKEYMQAFFGYLLRTSHTIPAAVFEAIAEYAEKAGKDHRYNGFTASGISAFQTVLKDYINTLDNKILQKKEWLAKENVQAELLAQRERERRQAEQLEAIRAELEKERLREAERIRKESDKLREDKLNKIYIRNAGLVLLHPFLGTFFTRLGLLDNGKFINHEARERAVLLLQYLVNGRNIAEEYELALNKILCGLAVEEVVPLEIILTSEEEAMTTELFEVIFQRWEKMKNTSVAGFRASFLQREGALSRLEGNWELKVEQRSYDMLLETLPWAFGMIKNTWMNQILTVEWI